MENPVSKEIEEKQSLTIVFVGHVDHGKSTIVGRLLADTGSLPQGKLEQVRESCERNSRPFEYAFLIDALRDERAQNITIDSARVFFKSAMRRYIIIDAPGHIEFIKNMVTGASRAEIAFLVIDAQEGVRENSRRHGYLLNMLGIKKSIVLVNKMDQVGYRQEAFEQVCQEYSAFLQQIGMEPVMYIPVSGREGDNLIDPSPKMSWFQGPTLLSALDSQENEPPLTDKAFRMPVQDVYRFTLFGDNRRIVAGRVSSGTMKVGDELVFYPSAKRSTVKSIEGFSTPPQSLIVSGQSVGFTLDEQIYIQRGEIASRSDQEPPKISTRFKASVLWLGKIPMQMQKEYWLKMGTAKVKAHIEKIVQVMDAGESGNPRASESMNKIQRNEVAECILVTNKDVAFDPAQDFEDTSRFVLVDGYEICGGGIILEDLGDEQKWVRDHVIVRNLNWEKSTIQAEMRAERYNQRSALVLVTGPRGVGRKKVAKQVESLLFEKGKIVYYLAIRSVLYGVDADIKDVPDQDNRQEHIRRLAEVAHILLDAGVILIVTAIELTQADLEIIKTTVDATKIITVWIGENASTDITIDLQLPDGENTDGSAAHIISALQDYGIIFRP